MLLLEKSSLPPPDFCVAIQKNNKVCGRSNCKIHKAKIALQKQTQREQELIKEIQEEKELFEKEKIQKEKELFEKEKLKLQEEKELFEKEKIQKEKELFEKEKLKLQEEKELFEKEKVKFQEANEQKIQQEKDESIKRLMTATSGYYMHGAKLKF